VLDLMICDETNPRSAAYQLVECVAHVEQLPNGSPDSHGHADEGLAAAMLNTIRKTDIIRVSREYEAGSRGALTKLLTSIDTTLPTLSDVISHRYFFHSREIQRLSEIDHPRDRPEQLAG